MMRQIRWIGRIRRVGKCCHQGVEISFPRFLRQILQIWANLFSVLFCAKAIWCVRRKCYPLRMRGSMPRASMAAPGMPLGEEIEDRPFKGC